MDLHYLRIFYEVAKEKSFTRAANNLYINQSAVSIQVKKFENNLDVELFDRSGKKIKMTYAGEVLFKTAEEIFQKVKRAEKELEKVILYKQGKISIGATHIVGEPFLPKILREFKFVYPGIKFDIHIQERDILLKMLKEGRIDVVLMGDFYVKEKNLLVMPINDYPFALLYNREIEDIKMLQELPLIGRDDSIMLEKNIDYLEKKHGVQLRERITVNGSVETIKNLVIEGLGYTILPYYSVHKQLENKELKLLMDLTEFKNGYQAVITEDKVENEEINKFLAFIKDFRIKK